METKIHRLLIDVCFDSDEFFFLAHFFMYDMWDMIWYVNDL